MEQYNEKGMVICQECGNALNQITVQHVRKHGISFSEYQAKYPNFPTVSKSFSAKQKLRNTKVFDDPNDITDKKEIPTKMITTEEEMEYFNFSDESTTVIPDKTEELEPSTEEIKIEDFGDIDIDKIPSIPKGYVEEISNFIDEVKSVVNEPIIVSSYPNPNNSIHKDKIKFLDFLLYYFPNPNYVENSYFVNKMNCEKVEERIVTDISIPSLKLDIEFPDTFWHNVDSPKHLRDNKLRLLGWTIIDVHGPKPSLTELKDLLKKFKLIR